MKTRIIEHKLGNETWYTVKYKLFLFWVTWKDAYGCEVKYNLYGSAEHRAKILENEETKEIVYETK